MLYFLNSYSSVDVAAISFKLLGNVLYDIPEGSVSQNVDLGPGYFLMLCRNFGKLFFHYYLHFSP